MLKVNVPATSANLGPGFDSIGIALNLYNLFYFFEKGKEQAPTGSHILEPSSLTHQALSLLSKSVQRKLPHLDVAIDAAVPRSRGLGSSATLTVAGLVAANVLLETQLSAEELIQLATKIEGHPDNAAPALLGGLVLTIMNGQEIKYMKMMPPKPLRTVLAVPNFELETSKARKVLPPEVLHRDAVINTSRFGYFVASMLTGDYSSLYLAMEDKLHQPYRMSLIPGLKSVMDAAVNAGALGSCLSGAGPSVLAFCTDNCDRISQEMTEAWQKNGITANTYVLDICERGTVHQQL